MTPLHALMLQRLAMAQLTRSQSELFWTYFELIAMHEAVNEQRALRGLDPVPMSDIEAAERQAIGREDYVERFARNCAALVDDAEY